MKRSTLVLLAILIGAPIATACDSGHTGASCLLGPCTPKVTIPEFEYFIAAAPNLSGESSKAAMKAGDSISVYFVRRRLLARCDEPADTMAGGTWWITGPYGQSGDYSGVASVTQRSSTRAVVLAKASGHFGIRYEPAANPDIPSSYVWQDVRTCPGNLAIMDIQVVP